MLGPMRVVAAILLAIVLGATLFVAGFAALHGLNAPGPDRAEDNGGVQTPGAFDANAGPLGREQPRIDFDKLPKTPRVRLGGRLAPAKGSTLPQELRAVLLAEESVDPITVRELTTDGSFDFGLVAKGRYRLEIVGKGGVQLLRKDGIVVDAEQQLRLELPKRQRVRFVLIDKAGKAIPSARLVLSRPGALRVHGRSDAQGRVDLDVEPGKWNWRVWDGQLEKSGELDLAVDQGLVRLTSG